MMAAAAKPTSTSAFRIDAMKRGASPNLHSPPYSLPLWCGARSISAPSWVAEKSGLSQGSVARICSTTKPSHDAPIWGWVGNSFLVLMPSSWVPQAGIPNSDLRRLRLVFPDTGEPRLQLDICHVERLMTALRVSASPGVVLVFRRCRIRHGLHVSGVRATFDRPDGRPAAGNCSSDERLQACGHGKLLPGHSTCFRAAVAVQGRVRNLTFPGRIRSRGVWSNTGTAPPPRIPPLYQLRCHLVVLCQLGHRPEGGDDRSR